MTDEELIVRLLEDDCLCPAEIAAEAADRIEVLVKERDEALEAKLDAIDTLNAWFDRRELGHAAVDKAVVDAVSGYLRVSRIGGMSKEQSDLILGVIADMAGHNLFADLFARTNVSAEAKAAKLVEALDNLLEAVSAEDRFRDRALTITGPTANLKWLLEAQDDARALLAEIEGEKK